MIYDFEIYDSVVTLDRKSKNHKSKYIMELRSGE